MSTQANLTYNKNDEREVSQEEKVSWCVACTLADSMKPCMTGSACPLAIGRAVRQVHLETLRLGDDALAIEALWGTLSPALWAAYWEYASPTTKRYFTLHEERCAEAMAGCGL